MNFVIGASIAFFVTFTMLPVVINVFNSLNLLDIPDRRKLHKVSSPSLGGLPMILTWLLTLGIMLPMEELAEIKFFLAGVILVFLLGIRDDVASLNANQKIIIQALAAYLVVHFAGIRLFDLHGFFGVDGLSQLTSELFSVFVIVALTNSYNLIDGIDGLAGGISLVAFVFLGAWFYHYDYVTFSLMSIILASTIMAFMYFNWYPSKIFMGDTGSMVIGFILSVLIIQFINLGLSHTSNTFSEFIGIATALLIVPIYDTSRVFLKRISVGQSPFYPDRNHVHHALLKFGLNHAEAAMTLISFTVFTILYSIALQEIGNTWIVIVQIIVAISFGAVLDLLVTRKSKEIEKTLGDKKFFVRKSA